MSEDLKAFAEALHQAEHPWCTRHMNTYYMGQARRLTEAGWGRVDTLQEENERLRNQVAALSSLVGGGA